MLGNLLLPCHVPLPAWLEGIGILHASTHCLSTIGSLSFVGSCHQETDHRPFKEGPFHPFQSCTHRLIMNNSLLRVGSLLFVFVFSYRVSWLSGLCLLLTVALPYGPICNYAMSFFLLCCVLYYIYTYCYMVLS